MIQNKSQNSKRESNMTGFLHENELRDLEDIKIVYNKYWAPLNWATTICMQAYKEGHIETLLAAHSIQAVAEALLNPLGEDDDDFECNFLIDKNIATGLTIVDDTYDVCPDLHPDKLSGSNYVPTYSADGHPPRKDSVLIGSAEAIE
uniref:Bestrophin homolog n=1 Tax=Angiostrongylus cantonensis TaxID=6313 RepID=A0A0K0DRR0_ANGCA